MYKKPLRNLQIDLVSACNARCPLCFRQTSRGNLNPHFPKNQHLDPAILIKALQDPAFSEVREILFCGNLGDAMASPQIVNVIDELDKIRPGIFIVIHTNGGIGTKSTWTELAQKLRHDERFVKFSIDGLEDTNSIYRRGVSWSKVMDNARTFIDAGGKAVWKFVIFEHNQHQIEEARALAKKMGFKGFQTRPNYAPEAEPVLAEDKVDFSLPENEALTDLRVSAETLQSVDIDCDAEKNEMAFIDFAGHLWPCCWIGGWKYSSKQGLRNYHHEQIESRWGANFNSLHHHTPSEILNHPWFKSQIDESWTMDGHKNGNPAHSECVNKCGQARCKSL